MSDGLPDLIIDCITDIKGKNIIVVGGGDSAIESALLLAGQNKVMLSYRNDGFSRLKPKNSEKINEARTKGLVDVRFKTNLLAIEKDEVIQVDDHIILNVAYLLHRRQEPCAGRCSQYPQFCHREK